MRYLALLLALIIGGCASLYPDQAGFIVGFQEGDVDVDGDVHGKSFRGNGDGDGWFAGLIVLWPLERPAEVTPFTGHTKP